MSVADRLREALYFETVKLVTVRNLKLGLFHRTMQFLVIAYVVVFAIWWKAGYQAHSEIDGVVFTKVKGIAHSPNWDTIYDASDLVLPAAENEAVFITTQSLSTYQTRGDCPDDSKAGIKCTSDHNCRNADKNTTENGYLTGECDNSTKYCVIRGWCPVENDSKPHTIYQGLEDWTLYMRSSVVYTSFNVTANNGNKATLGYNIFNVSYMLGDQNLSGAMETGAIIRIALDWSCDLNKDDCLPVYSFKRVDNEPGAVNVGYNYRAVVYKDENGKTIQPGQGETTVSRVVTKYYGLRFLIEVTGEGVKFDIFTLVITVGSGVALFGATTILMDLLLSHLHPRRKHYDKAKRAELRFEAGDDPTLEDPINPYSTRSSAPMRI